MYEPVFLNICGTWVSLNLSCWRMEYFMSNALLKVVLYMFSSIHPNYYKANKQANQTLANNLAILCGQMKKKNKYNF